MGSARRVILRELYVSLAAVGGLLLLLGVVGGLLKERSPISGPLIALLAGVQIGPPSGCSTWPSWATRRSSSRRGPPNARHRPCWCGPASACLLRELQLATSRRPSGDLDAADVDSLGAIGVP